MNRNHEFRPQRPVKQSPRILQLLRGVESGSEEGWMVDTYFGRRQRLILLSHPLVEGHAVFPLMEDAEIMPETDTPEHLVALRQKIYTSFQGLLAEADVAPRHVGVRIEQHAPDFVPFRFFSALGKCMLDHFPAMNVVGLYAADRLPEHRFDGWQFTRNSAE